jgi:hypothetical protein
MFSWWYPLDRALKGVYLSANGSLSVTRSPIDAITFSALAALFITAVGGGGEDA